MRGSASNAARNCSANATAMAALRKVVRMPIACSAIRVAVAHTAVADIVIPMNGSAF
jgi:hypothetical protein